MDFYKLAENAKIYFPNLKIKYKNESLFMKLLGYLLFFNKSFMNGYTTTIGSTIYFTSRDKIKSNSLSSSIVLLHELVHIYDSKRLNKLLFSFLYLFPQILSIFSIILFLINWKIALLFMIFLLPFPAYFRMHFEKRAYLASLYVMKQLGKRLNYTPLLQTQKDFFIKQFKSSSYYYMWIFKNIDKEFDNALMKIIGNKRPYEDYVFDIIDDLIDKQF